MPIRFKNKSTDSFRVQFEYAIRLPVQAGGFFTAILNGLSIGANVGSQYEWHDEDFTIAPRPPGKAIAHPIHKPYFYLHRARVRNVTMTNLRTGAVWQFPNKFGWYRVEEGGDLVGVRPSRAESYNYGIGPVFQPPLVAPAVTAPAA